MKKFKVLVTIFLVLAVMLNVGFIMFNANVDKANASSLKINSWNLVDSGKHLDWDGNSTFTETWALSVSAWNAVHNIIRPDSWRWIQDVWVTGYYTANDNVMGYCTSGGTIAFNGFYFNTMTNDERQKTQMHEIGHALGLDENNTSLNSIMKQGRRAQVTLAMEDVEAFDYLYNNIY